MSTAKIISEVIAIISGNKEEWGRVTVEHAGYTFHIYYDAAFDTLAVEHVIYNVISGEYVFTNELPSWFEDDIFKSVVFSVMELRYKEIKEEREIEAMERGLAKQKYEKKKINTNNS